MINLITSWDDGSKWDFKLAELLKKYNIPAVFFIPSICNIDEGIGEKGIIDISKDFEIGGHTVNHPDDIKRLTKIEKTIEIVDNKEYLEDLCCYKLRWYCHPRGRYDEETNEILRLNGFKYARTTLIGELSSISEFNYRMPTTIHIYNRSEYNGENWLEYAKRIIYEMDKLNSKDYVHIWGHSWEIEINDQWDRLEELFIWLNNNFDINRYETLHYTKE
jgi:peptidoglycan/xylan/chitin deacetylase (PgdA/CDA1 family)